METSESVKGNLKMPQFPKEIAFRDLFLDIKNGKITELELKVKNLKLDQIFILSNNNELQNETNVLKFIILSNNNELQNDVSVLKSEKNELLSAIRSKNERISDLEERNKNLKDYVEYRDNRIDYLEKNLIPNIWEKVAEGNDLIVQKKELFFAKCEKISYKTYM